MISMTWPQYQRGECRLTVNLSPQECEVLSTLLLRHPSPVTIDELIEALYPDPDCEPEFAKRMVQKAILGIREKIGTRRIASSPFGYGLLQ